MEWVLRERFCVSSKKVGNLFINIVLYVDGKLLIRNNMDAIEEVKSQLPSKFDVKGIDDDM